MANSIPNLWSEAAISLQILSPLAILRSQASNLEQMTKGLLKVDIREMVDTKGETIFYRFEIVAPALNGYRHRLFSLTHAKDQVYPIGFALPPEVAKIILWARAGDDVAMTEEQFIAKLGDVLKSGYVNSVIQSLIARSNDDSKIREETSAGSS